jgi:phosphoglycolate phosphatase
MSATLTSPEIILFDWDNTLVDSWPTIHEALNHCLVAMGHEPWDRAQVMANSRLSMRDGFPKLFGDQWEKAAKIFQEYHSSIHLERLKPYAQAEAMLQSLKAAGVKAGVVSNKRGPALRAEVEKLGWGGYFVAVVGAGDAQKDKPHPHPALMALEGQEISAPEAVWFVGDTVVDLECGAAIGGRSIYFGDQAEGQTLEGVHFDTNITQLNQLSELINR